ncbi:MAG: S8 family serine peptidase [Proteobacteria bacterium]|nr:S8 family serine peptidase [Pseudomonadota bacterium]
MILFRGLIAYFLSFSLASAAQAQSDYLVKLQEGFDQQQSFISLLHGQSGQVEVLARGWIRVQNFSQTTLHRMSENPSVEYIQPNYPLGLLKNYQIQDPLRRAAFQRSMSRHSWAEVSAMPADNPTFPRAPSQKNGNDPLLATQWSMANIEASEGWKKTQGSSEMIVAILDTGVDYTHEDLLPNMWRNPGEEGTDAAGRDKSTNGIDDDGNGYVDDLMGWDFAAKDNKPFDLAVDPKQLLISGGNPGHGTHCSGNVAARGFNSLGIAGVAPNVKVMALRFISEKGQGTTADAVMAIRYAVDNGAKVLSNSWGGEGSRSDGSEENLALKEAIQYAEAKGTLFIAAAGNGRAGTGYDMDKDPTPVYPASYDFENIISVAAIDVKNELGAFSNWGATSVDIGAPGVAVLSTTVGGKYSDKVLDFAGFDITWDGTSMATPHVAGAAALYWSLHPNKTWREVKDAILKSAAPTPALRGKTTTEGILNIKSLMNM